MKAIGKDDEQKQPEMSEDDMIYYLFVIHDLNGDGYLDGHELRAAFSDFDHDDEDQHVAKAPETIPFDEITEMVDHVLEEDDKNGEQVFYLILDIYTSLTLFSLCSGLISWSEYLESQLYHEQ